MLTTYNVLHDINSLLDSFMEPRQSCHDLANVDFIEENDTIKIKYLVPEAKIEDIEIQLENSILKVNYNRSTDDAKRIYIRKERRSGSFNRSIKLPYKVDSENTEASLTNGVLTILLKKSPDALPKKIEIN